MRVFLVLLAALTLGACSNTVYSRSPLIPEAHEGGDPEFRPGLYLVSGFEDRCAFDIRTKLSLWPDCAVGVEFARGQMWLVNSHQRLLAMTQRFLPGEPVIVQGHFNSDVLKDPRVTEPRDMDNPFFGWTYAAVTVVRTDGIGRIMEATITPAVCGPLPDKAPVGQSQPRPYIDRPFKGLAMAGANCRASDLDTVRNALVLSAALSAPRTIKWMRDNP